MKNSDPHGIIMRTLHARQSFPPETLHAARHVRAAIFDVDGVLTDGRIYIGESGEAFKAFNTLDGHGMKLIARAGITPIVITGRDAPAIRRRVQDLGIQHAVYGVHDKWEAARPIIQELGLDWAHHVAVMGDDWPDLPLMLRCAWSVAPANAHVEVQQTAHHVTQAAGGHGAGREFCDMLLMATGHYEHLLQGHLTTLDGGQTR